MLYFGMVTRPTRSTRTDTLFPDMSLVRSFFGRRRRQHELPLLPAGTDAAEPAGPAVRREHVSVRESAGQRSDQRQDGGPIRRVQQKQDRSEGQPSELQSLMRLSYAVFCMKK